MIVRKMCPICSVECRIEPVDHEDVPEFCPFCGEYFEPEEEQDPDPYGTAETFQEG